MQEASGWRKFFCAIGFHGESYKTEYTPFEERGIQKRRASFVKYCPHCPNGRKVIVERSLLLGD